MVSLVAVKWDGWESDVVSSRPFSEAREVIAPKVLPRSLYFFSFFKLSKKVSGENVRQAKTGTHIHPGVLVNLTLQEALSVRTLVPNDFRAFKEIFVVHHQSTTLAARQVFGLVKA